MPRNNSNTQNNDINYSRYLRIVKFWIKKVCPIKACSFHRYGIGDEPASRQATGFVDLDYANECDFSKYAKLIFVLSSTHPRR